MKVLTRNGDWEEDRAMDIDHPLYRALSSGRKRVNGESFWISLSPGCSLTRFLLQSIDIFRFR